MLYWGLVELLRWGGAWLLVRWLRDCLPGWLADVPGVLSWARLDPRSIVVESVPRVATTWATFLLFRESFPFDDRFVREYLQAAAVGVTAAAVVHQIVRWATTSDAVGKRTVRRRAGWLLRRRTAVDRARVRAVVLRSGALARPLGPTRVSVGTGETRRRWSSPWSARCWSTSSAGGGSGWSARPAARSKPAAG